MKKFITLMLACLVLSACFVFPTQAAEASVYVTVETENGDKINISPRENVFYLPSAADITKLALSTGETLDLTGAKTQDERGAECYKLALAGGEFTFYCGENLPTVFVTTSKGLSYIESNKENRDKNAKITIVDENGGVEYADTAETKSEIKGRGNATFGYYKKPYQIKLAEKTKLLGMDKSKTWILLAGYTDQSALHNALGFSMGDALGVPYNIEYRFADLYIDGEYRGLYMLCEKVQVGSGRVDIAELEKANEEANEGVDVETLPITHKTSGSLINNTIITEYSYVNTMKSPADITGGYLIELDNNYGTREPCYFKTENGNVYVVKEPEYASRAEVEYIAEIFADMEEAIYSETGYNSKGKHYTEYMDIGSFAAVYTVQELMKNWDAYTSSMFFYKDADKDGVQAKIYCGPLWDLDNTLGNINFNQEYGQDTAYLWAQNGEFYSYGKLVVRTFAKNLMKHYDFQKSVEKAYAEAYEFVNDALAEGGWLEENAEKIYPSVMMDRTRWEMYDSERWLLNSAGHKTGVKFVWFAEYGTASDTENDTALGFLRYYLSARAEALKASIGKATAEPPQNTTGTASSTNSSTGTTAAQPPAASGPNYTALISAAIFGALAVVICISVVAVMISKKRK